MSARVVIFGAAGYTGGELVRLLAGHPGVELIGLYGSSSRASSTPIESEFPDLRDRVSLAIEPGDLEAALSRRPDVAMLCTPHEASASLARGLLGAGVRVLDLSGAFRLSSGDAYPQHYGFEHPASELLASAVYGLPELGREGIGDAELVAVPGCYPTASLLGLSPIARAGAIQDGWRPIIDATSGVSGAGRGANKANLFGEVSHRPYGVLGHRHTPEIETYLGRSVVFTPHVGPYFRGIVATMHVRVSEDWDAAGLRRLLTDAYTGEAFVRVLPAGEWPSVAGVAGTNMCDIGVACDADGHAIVVSAIDNLLKGAAGQAVQCLNIQLGLPETAGLA